MLLRFQLNDEQAHVSLQGATVTSARDVKREGREITVVPAPNTSNPVLTTRQRTLKSCSQI